MDCLQRELGDEFDFMHPLGVGTFAEVFLAREKGLDRAVAVKVMRRSLATDVTAAKRFLREARLAARIRHPNVLAIHRVGELRSERRPYLVREYVDGQTFDDVLAAEGPLPEPEVRRIVGEVCDALAAAHALGIIHRDVRPGNIMRVRSGGRIVLTDFGLAGILETGGEAVTRLTGAGEILGRVGYAPPEQLKGETIRPGSDVYAVAVTAYELMTGRGPFPDAQNEAQQIRAHLTGEPVPIRRVLSSATPEIEDLLIRCLHKRPDQRPGADLLARRLRGAASDEVGAARGPLESFLAELKRRRVYKVGAAYGAFILVILALVDGALPALPFPFADWTGTAIVTGALAGLPVALIIGWFFDVQRGGVERTRPLGSGGTRSLHLIQGTAFALTLATTALLGWYVLLR